MTVQTDAGMAALEEHWRTQLAGFDYSAQRHEPVRVPVPASPVSQPGMLAADQAAGVELGWQAQIGAQIGGLAADMRALRQRADADNVPWQEVHPFDLPFASSSQSTVAGQTLTSETWGPRAGWAWDVRRITVQGLNGPASPQTSTTIGNPAPGANLVYTNNSGAPQTLLAIQGVFTASATVLNRFVQVQAADGLGHQIYRIVDTTAVVASTSVSVVAYQGAPFTPAATGTTFLPLGQGIVIPAGGNVSLVASPIDPADQWSAIVVTVAGSTAADVVTIYKAPIAAQAGAVPVAAIDNITGSGAGSDLLITQKGAFLMQSGDALLIAGPYAAPNITVSGSGTEVALHRLPWYLK